MDGKAIEAAAAAQLVRAVRTVRERHPDHTVYGAMFHEFYGDGSTIAWPMVTVGTEESLAEVVAEYADRHGEFDDLVASLRWSGPDLEHGFDPDDDDQALADTVQAEAGPGFERWERAYERFLRCFPRAAKAARSSERCSERSHHPREPGCGGGGQHHGGDGEHQQHRDHR